MILSASLKKKLPEFRQPRRETDKCSWCYKYKHEVVPAFEKTYTDVRKELEEFHSGYFEKLLASPAYKKMSESPVSKCHMFRLFIDKMVTETPTRQSFGAW